MTAHDDAVKAWREAQKASQDAREAVERAKLILREAEVHFQRMWDEERFKWLDVRNTQWVKITDEMMENHDATSG